MEPVTEERIQIAREFGLVHVREAAEACREAGLPFWAACALLEKESGGRNVYGHDQGGALSGFPGEVNRGNFEVFEWLVFERGWTSNGVGPTQITFKGYFTQMKTRGLKAWLPRDNMIFGFGLLAHHYDVEGSWQEAGASYNGASAYGTDLVKKLNEWRERLNIKGGDVR